MRVVLDTNFATDPALEQWLKRSTGNVAVLTDYFAMESYRTARWRVSSACTRSFRGTPIKSNCYTTLAS